jgi:hypothetical protein
MSSERYRAKAAELDQLAERAKSASVKAQCRDMAADWRQLAESAEALSRRIAEAEREAAE